MSTELIVVVVALGLLAVFILLRVAIEQRAKRNWQRIMAAQAAKMKARTLPWRLMSRDSSGIERQIANGQASYPEPLPTGLRSQRRHYSIGEHYCHLTLAVTIAEAEHVVDDLLIVKADEAAMIKLMTQPEPPVRFRPGEDHDSLPEPQTTLREIHDRYVRNLS